MKILAWLLMLASSCCPALLAENKNSVAKFARDAVTEHSKSMTAAAAEMPADKYGFKASPEQMTFGQLTLHIADGNYLFCSKIGGISPPELPKISDTDSKGRLVERMKSSFDFCKTAFAKLDDSKMGEALDLGDMKVSRAMAILTLSGSWNGHYLMQAADLQLNGLAPPATK